MAKVGISVEIRIGEDGLIELREPTNREWNEFDQARYPINRNKVKYNATAARAGLFDKLVIRLENIEDGKGKIGLEELDRIPDRVKADVIFKAFEQTEQVELKNS
jgi:hypothetical protein